MFLNLEGHQNCKIGSKVTTIFTTFLSCRLDPESQDVPAEGVSRGRPVAVSVGVSDMLR